MFLMNLFCLKSSWIPSVFCTAKAMQRVLVCSNNWAGQTLCLWPEMLPILKLHSFHTQALLQHSLHRIQKLNKVLPKWMNSVFLKIHCFGIHLYMVFEHGLLKVHILVCLNEHFSFHRISAVFHLWKMEIIRSCWYFLVS